MFLSGENYHCHPHVVRKDGSELPKLADRGGYPGVVEALKYPDFHGSSSDVSIWPPDGRSIYDRSKIEESTDLMRVDLVGNTTQPTHSRPGTRNSQASFASIRE